jgi:hypothetical protein
MYNADAVTMRIPKISLSFIRGIEFDIVFDISKDITSKINTLGGMVDNADKLYFTKDGDYIFATFTDESLSNVDSVSFKVSEYMNDNFEPFIIIYKNIKGRIPLNGNNITISFKPSKNMLKFDVKKMNSTISYILSLAVK